MDEGHSHQAAMKNLRRRILLPAATAVVVALAAPGAASAKTCHHTGADPNEISIKKVQTATLCLINNRRRKRGLPRLSENRRLDLASMRHARDMARRNFFEHGDFLSRIKRADYLSGAGTWAVGENIAWGAGSYARPAAIVRMWMNSPPHRANLLHPRFRMIGIGSPVGNFGGYAGASVVTADFGG